MRQAASVGLIGACVSRDMKESLFPGVRSHYLWRISTISMMSAAPSRLEIEQPNGDGNARRTVECDVNKSFDLPQVLSQPYVLIDFFRDMYGVLVLRDGRVITNGIEVEKFGADALGLEVRERIESFDPRYAELWLRSFRAFCDQANASAAQFLIVPVYQLGVFWNDKAFSVMAGWRPEQIISRNLILGHMQRIALALLHNALVVPLLPEVLALDTEHEYGPGPYHFHRSAFDRAVQVMATLPEFVPTLSVSPTRAEHIVGAELHSWRALKSRSASFAIRPVRDALPFNVDRSIEMVLPLRLDNGERGSDFLRARDGLIASINRFADPNFVKRLTIVVPAEDVARADELATACSIDTHVIAESELIDIQCIGPIPRRGWYVQQLIKLAYANVCSTKFYITLDADVLLISALDADVLRNAKAPAKLEPASAHPGWWNASARVMEERMSAQQFDAERTFGITPAFLRADIVRAMTTRLDDIAKRKGEEGWLSYLRDRTSIQNDGWTEYSLYWTFLINHFKVEDIYFPSEVYYYTHYHWHAADMISDAERRRQHLFCILQSSHVDEQSHAAVVKRVLALDVETGTDRARVAPTAAR